MMEARAEFKKIGWATDGGGSDMKFFKIILTWNHGFNSGHKEIHAYLLYTVKITHQSVKGIPSPRHTEIGTCRYQRAKGISAFSLNYFCTMP